VEKREKVEKSRKKGKKSKKGEKVTFASERPFLEIGFPGPQTFCGHCARVYRKKWSIGAPSEKALFRVFAVFSGFPGFSRKTRFGTDLGPRKTASRS